MTDSPQPLELPLRPGMRGVDTTVDLTGTIIAVTEQQCVLRLDTADELLVRPWPQVALLGIRPSPESLPADVEQRDWQNAISDVLRSLLRIERPNEDLSALAELLMHELSHPDSSSG